MSEIPEDEEFNRESDTEWLPTGPELGHLDWDEYADLLAEVAEIEAEKSEQTGH